MVSIYYETAELVRYVSEYVLGFQLPIVAYRSGQHITVYVFIMRTRRETRTEGLTLNESLEFCILLDRIRTPFFQCILAISI